MRYLTMMVLLVFALASSSEAGSKNPQVELETSKGTILLEVYPDKAPKTVDNFLRYVRWGQYDSTIFHRVIPNFMIQGGGFTPQMKQKLTQMAVENEADNGLKNDRGAIAMARTQDPHSATAQFFINVKDNAFLNHKSKTQEGWGYTVFGKVIEGMDVVDAVSKVKTGAKAGMSDVPVEDVVIIKAVIKE